MTDTDKPCCSFCGAEKSPTVPLIAGNEGRICEACVKLAHQVVTSWGQRRQAQQLAPQLLTPAAYMQHLDESVIGQDEAKETLAVAVYNHYLRLLNCTREPVCQLGGTVELEKSNILMAGPSGTGKTLLVRTLARILGVPFASADATTLTQAGYVGDDVDSIIARLLEAAGGDVQKAQWGIVYIDEVDKLARRGGGGTAVRDISGEGVQQALLKLVEGSEVRIGKGGRRGEHGEEQVVDTRNILFIAGGAFPGLETLVGSRVHPRGSAIGFHARPQQQAPSINELLAALLPDDLHEFGLIPEFIGRFPIITFLRELDHATLLRILSEPRNALVKQYQQLFAYQGVKLEFSEAALGHIADQALLRRTGARGLRAVMESALQRTMFEMPAQPQLRSCLLDLDEEGRELVVLRQFDEYAEAQPADSRAAAASWQRSLLVVDG
ncbi:ATP-dependent Clp protease ATP-binding subunit ClpX [Pseudomonas stutzeri]|jgi:ATP-dependent Clp protease ATP-binding subunit ClpX|uniref:ATP-dependent Clp protease, ATP-binding subunit ClpX n=3 Tax=Stutzerimonas stutzeri TaxID=316 RepID=A4VJA2_STUS1|nr:MULTISPECIES: ATP-dependent Clp protease ATP-binding subunit ClpX [Stutzerimonas]EPL62077.1 ATP-dependent protease ATP-binding subunit ClpX [Stutzerimonas stutzeri B1SMN1]MBA4690054.1 ATP-dependent Clp protease ATP-binding subunit ClpX [Pseudomonas sp.]NMY64729.1 ATP-dependent Clp protease ATP-binding subunit ClpX [Pseudomonas sp. WS 5018]OHC16942.1 MAG: ATP-dependent protease ATP-binding subunit ClpX [Pseudomonadales bacterium RIFCSPHIGHO2_01_FULL_64_12]ABP79053.1 ATP-dependent Clp proteas